MNFIVTRLPLVNTSFDVHAKQGFKTLGIAHFYKQDSLWKARVDVKEKYRGRGIASQLLSQGDSYISTHFNGDLREFENLNDDYPYKRYTDEIPDEQIVSYEKNHLRFRP